jgi:hypothetical protein
MLKTTIWQGLSRVDVGGDIVVIIVQVVFGINEI